MSGSLFGHVGVMFWSCRGHFFVVVGMSWDVFGSTVGSQWGRFGRFWGTKEDGVDKSVLKNDWEYFFRVGGTQTNVFSRLPEKSDAT